jgi:adenosylcobinamide-GDP ribazoletransferase
VADFFDAFGGGWNRDDILRILKDSRIGSYGVTALVLSLALRAGSMVILVERFGYDRWYCWAAVLVASAAIGRFVIVIVMAVSPPAPHRESLSRDIGSQATVFQVLLGGALVLPGTVVGAILQPASFVIALLILVPGICYFVWYVKRRIGGMTGDCLGCICYVSQLIVLLAAAVKV